jgi:type IV pilus assembly protein PilQ
MQAFTRVIGITVATFALATLPAQEGGAGEQEGVSSQAEGDRASRLTLRLRDRDLGEVIESIRRKTNSNIIMDPGIEETVTIDLQDVHWRQALSLVVEQAECIVTEGDGGVLKIEKPPRVYFAFENTEIQKVIDTIAKISGANIVVAPEVQGTITVRLKNIPWRDALDAAVKTLGFVVVEEARGILRVVPAANIEADLAFEAIQLRYVRPSSVFMPFINSEYIRDMRNQQPLQPGQLTFTLLDTLKNMVTPEVGSLEYVQETNVIMVKDTRPVVDQIRRTIQMMDIEPAQVQLDVRFVTTSNDDLLDVGVSPGGNGWTAGLSLGQMPTRLPFDLGAGGWDDRLVANPQGFGPFADDAQNLPASTTIPDVVFGALNFQEVTATLRLLARDSNSEILQAPQITTLDNTTATIFVGEAVRYAQARVEQGQAGGLLLALEEGDESPVNIGFQLLATPHIVPGTDKVIMEVIPQRTALSGTGTSSIAPAGFDVFEVGAAAGAGQIALPRVASSTLQATILLQSGQTAVLGGLKSKTESETVTKLPLLGDIPLLGYLFKNRTKQETMSTLLVFITPQVIRSADDVESSMRRALEERMKDQRSSLAQTRDAIFGK